MKTKIVENGEVLTIVISKNKIEYLDIYNNLHRKSGPAIKSPKSKFEAWCLRGNLHREDGPALINYQGIKSYYLNGNEVHKSEIDQYICSRRIKKLRE